MLAVSIVLPHFFGASVLVYIALLVKLGVQKELQFKLSGLSWLWIGFYLIYAIGVLWTNNIDIALKSLEYKLAFALFPLLLGLIPKTGPLRFPIVMAGLVIGVGIASLMGLVNSFLCYFDGGGRTCFLTVFISPVHHPTYFVAYWIIAICAAWYGRKLGWKNYSLKWIIPFSLFGLILHVLSLSLAGILFFLILSYVLLSLFLFRKYGKTVAILGSVMIPLLAFLFLTRAPQVEGEWHAAKWYADEYIKNPTAFVESRKFPMSGSEERLVLWTVSCSEIVNHPLGVGTGNTEEVLSQALKKRGQFELAELNRNPHNQFLQTTLEVGIPGLLIFLTILINGVVTGIRKSNPLLGITVACLAFNCLFESMLQRQSGVVFFVILTIVLQEHGKKDKNLTI